MKTAVPFSPKYADAVKRLHEAQGHSYVLPNDFSGGVVLVEDFKPTHALLFRTTAEAYWLFDPAMGSRRENIGDMMILKNTGTAKAIQLGYSDVHCWLPPELGKLDKLMKHVGWRKMTWQSYRFPLK